MRRITITLQGEPLDLELARKIGEVISSRENEETTLVSWCDSVRHIHSPQCLHCEIKGEPGWEVYGRNHGGRLRISFNEEAVVLIYS